MYQNLKKKLLLKKIKTLNNYYLNILKKSSNCSFGLNPHNLEFKKNSEELKS